MKCFWKNCENELLPPRKKYCSNKCKNIATTTESKRKLKSKLIAHFGGKCVRCGYNKSNSALHFHHLDPTTKEFGLGRMQTASWEKSLAEAKKCILICANCHAEEHELLDSI